MNVLPSAIKKHNFKNKKRKNNLVSVRVNHEVSCWVAAPPKIPALPSLCRAWPARHKKQALANHLSRPSTGTPVLGNSQRVFENQKWSRIYSRDQGRKSNPPHGKYAFWPLNIKFHRFSIRLGSDPHLTLTRFQGPPPLKKINFFFSSKKSLKNTF